MPKGTTSNRSRNERLRLQQARQKNATGGGTATIVSFKFNKNLGQHILKNPLVAQGIIDKVILFYN